MSDWPSPLLEQFGRGPVHWRFASKLPFCPLGVTLLAILKAICICAIIYPSGKGQTSILRTSKVFTYQDAEKRDSSGRWSLRMFLCGSEGLRGRVYEYRLAEHPAFGGTRACPGPDPGDPIRGGKESFQNSKRTETLIFASGARFNSSFPLDSTSPS